MTFFSYFIGYLRRFTMRRQFNIGANTKFNAIAENYENKKNVCVHFVECHIDLATYFHIYAHFYVSNVCKKQLYAQPTQFYAIRIDSSCTNVDFSVFNVLKYGLQPLKNLIMESLMMVN